MTSSQIGYTGIHYENVIRENTVMNSDELQKEQIELRVSESTSNDQLVTAKEKQYVRKFDIEVAKNQTFKRRLKLEVETPLQNERIRRDLPLSRVRREC